MIVLREWIEKVTNYNFASCSQIRLTTHCIQGETIAWKALPCRALCIVRARRKERRRAACPRVAWVAVQLSVVKLSKVTWTDRIINLQGCHYYLAVVINFATEEKKYQILLYL